MNLALEMQSKFEKQAKVEKNDSDTSSERMAQLEDEVHQLHAEIERLHGIVECTKEEGGSASSSSKAAAVPRHHAKGVPSSTGFVDSRGFVAPRRGFVRKYEGGSGDSAEHNPTAAQSTTPSATHSIPYPHSTHFQRYAHHCLTIHVQLYTMLYPIFYDMLSCNLFHFSFVSN